MRVDAIAYLWSTSNYIFGAWCLYKITEKGKPLTEFFFLYKCAHNNMYTYDPYMELCSGGLRLCALLACAKKQPFIVLKYLFSMPDVVVHSTTLSFHKRTLADIRKHFMIQYLHNARGL